MQIDCASADSASQLVSALEVDSEHVKKCGRVPEAQMSQSQDEYPNDPQFAQQPHYVGSPVDMAPAWAMFKGSPNVVVGITDSGMDMDHPDLEQNKWRNAGEINCGAGEAACCSNGIDDDNNGYADDCYGYNFADNMGGLNLQGSGSHGTHVAGIVAADSHNGVGVTGTAGGRPGEPGAALMTLTCFGNTNTGGFAESIVYAADMGAAISQNSWGYTSAGYVDQAVLDAIDYFNVNAGGQVVSDGGLVVFAAGNDGSDAQHYPGYYEGTVAVAALQHSSPAAASFTNYGDWVDISAPGVSIHSTYVDSYGSMSGTSMACPFVSGILALMIGYSPGKTRASYIQCMSVSADNIDAVNPGKEGKLGAGVVNPHRAFLECLNTPRPPPSPPTLPPPPLSPPLPPLVPPPPSVLVSVSVFTDNYPGETSWKFTRVSDGAELATGGSYTSQGTLYTEAAMLGWGEFDFTIVDSYGDGICCSYGPGWYKVESNGFVMKEGGSFGSSETTRLTLPFAKPPPSPPTPPSPPPPLPSPPTPPFPPAYSSCTDACVVGGLCEDGQRHILVGSSVREVTCVMDGSRGLDITVASGLETRRYTDANSCPAGMDIWVPRTLALVNKVFDQFGDAAQLVGIYGTADGACGGCTNAAMNSDEPSQAAHWSSVASSTGAPAEPWFMRAVPYSEPNGDYTSGCWLGHRSVDSEGIQMNDYDCNYVYTSYLCSTNKWTPPSPPSPPPPASLPASPSPPLCPEMSLKYPDRAPMCVQHETLGCSELNANHSIAQANAACIGAASCDGFSVASAGLHVKVYKDWSGVAQLKELALDEQLNPTSREPAAVLTVAEADGAIHDEILSITGNDNFVLRYSGQFMGPASGEATFETMSDDGTLLYVNGQLVVDNDGAHAPITRSGTLTLQAGVQYRFVVLFAQLGGGKDFRLRWTPPGEQGMRLLSGAALSCFKQECDGESNLEIGGLSFYEKARNLCSEPVVPPSAAPSASPSAIPSVSLTATPSASPSVAPSASPTATPSASPSAAPSASPTATPSASPTATPSASPTATPSASPSAATSASPSAAPSASPTASSSASPSAATSDSPSAAPSASPSASSSAAPSAQPSAGAPPAELHLLAGVAAVVQLSAAVAQQGDFLVFLPSGDASCVGAAANRRFTGAGGVLAPVGESSKASTLGVSVRLAQNGAYKACVARGGGAADADYSVLESLHLFVSAAPPPSPSPPPTPPPPFSPPPELALSPTLVSAGVESTVSVSGGAAQAGDTLVFLKAGDASCHGAAANRAFTGAGGKLVAPDAAASGPSPSLKRVAWLAPKAVKPLQAVAAPTTLSVRLSEPGAYKVCVAHDATPSTDADFAFVPELTLFVGADS